LAWFLGEFLESRRGQVKLLQRSFVKELENDVCDVGDFFYVVELA
jgi:hypothetical protein